MESSESVSMESSDRGAKVDGVDEVESVFSLICGSSTFHGLFVGDGLLG